VNNTPILVIAHRGAKGEAPENTLAAFRLGLEQGCDAVELDVHLSQDNVVIVCHDDTLDRTTDSKGEIRSLTVEEIKQADAGQWFHERYKGERIPTMEEVFDLIPPGIMINIEIKNSYNSQLEPALIELIHRKQRLADVVISSFDFKSLALIKLLEPSIKIGLLYDVNFTRHSSIADSLGLPVYSMHPSFRRINAEEVKDCSSKGLQVYPYTINDEKQMKLAIQYGVAGIITDFPGKLRALLEGSKS